MRVLTLNCGSSSLKYGLYRASGGAVANLGGGTIRGLGPGVPAGAQTSYRDAVGQVAVWVAGAGPPAAVAHRIVHGGRLAGPALMTPPVLAELDAYTKLAPLHNGPALQAAHAAFASFGPQTPHIAVFDTAFHQTMPDYASQYAIPFTIAERHGIRRFGFHGLAHRSMVERFGASTNQPVTAIDAVTLQLGSGCSATAIRQGRSLDTSMGFTPLEGLMMGTRSGDIDPALVGFLAQAEAQSAAEVESLLNNQSGLLGVSGVSADVPTLLQAEAGGNERAGRALDMFCYRAARYLASYLGLLGSAVVLFGGGIGENSPAIRARIAAHLAFSGLRLHDDRNQRTVGIDGLISADDSRWACHVMCVDEEALLARDAAALLAEVSPPAE